MLLIAIVTCLIATTWGDHLEILDGKIIGGSDASIEQYPYQLSLETSGFHNCGASIVSANWALTAAHCSTGPIGSMSLRAGTSLRGTGGTLHAVQQAVVHSQFNAATFDFDIALLRVSTPFVFGVGVAPIALPAQGEAVATGTDCDVTGWGTTVTGGTLPAQLQAVTVPIVDQDRCQLSYISYDITDRMVCAGRSSGGVGSCKGDSGGPMVSGGKLVGLVSWGVGCAQAGRPGVYTRVANLRDWIKQSSAV